MTITFSKNFLKFFSMAIGSLYVTYTIVTGIAQEYIRFAGVANEIGTAFIFLCLFVLTFIASLTCIKFKR
jgi:hypothetical protein